MAWIMLMRISATNNANIISVIRGRTRHSHYPYSGKIIIAAMGAVIQTNFPMSDVKISRVKEDRCNSESGGKNDSVMDKSKPICRMEKIGICHQPLCCWSELTENSNRLRPNKKKSRAKTTKKIPSLTAKIWPILLNFNASSIHLFKNGAVFTTASAI